MNARKNDLRIANFKFEAKTSTNECLGNGSEAKPRARSDQKRGNSTELGQSGIKTLN